MAVVRSGLEVMAGQAFAPLRGRRVGLVTHPAAVDAELRHAADLIGAAKEVGLTVVFGPEHGLLGQAQDLIGVEAKESREGHAATRVVSLYGADAASLRPSADDLSGLDVLVIDLQDIGSRYYTFQATMLYCLEAALPRGLPVIVLDRPNPLGGVAVEGPRLSAGNESFVGAHDLAIRHGLTMGELARLYVSERGLHGAELTVVACEGWRREMLWAATGLPWVLPSPNMPTPETALVYPGQCLIEGTNLSEGRGTTRPFEISGAPWLPARELAARLTAERLPGAVFRPLWFRPTFQKHAGLDCGGVQIHVVDPVAFQPVRTGAAVLAAMRDLSGNHFQWRREVYEFVREPIAIDLLFGNRREREALEAGASWRDLAAAWEAEEAAFRERRRAAMIY